MQISIKDYFEYFPSGPREEGWTFHVSAAGRAHIAPGDPYPPPKHPEDHDFTWEQGRILPALQVVGISRGSGMIEWRTENRRLAAGDVFVLEPGIWHRYRPDPYHGWTEEWIEFRGRAAESWVGSGLTETPVVNLKDDAPFWDRFAQLHRLCIERPAGYRAVSAGLALSLLAEVVSKGESSAKASSSPVPGLIRSARGLLLGGAEIREVARSLGVSYPTLYRRFKEATGISPKDYAGQIRRARAEDFLLRSNLSVKEIAARLGYHSASHFSSEFKNSHGMAPALWRDRGEGKCESSRILG